MHACCHDINIIIMLSALACACTPPLPPPSPPAFLYVTSSTIQTWVTTKKYNILHLVQWRHGSGILIWHCSCVIIINNWTKSSCTVFVELISTLILLLCTKIIFNILTAWVYMHRLGWKLNVHATYVHYEDQDIHNIRKLLVCFGAFWDSLAWFNYGKRQRPPHK